MKDTRAEILCSHRNSNVMHGGELGTTAEFYSNEANCARLDSLETAVLTAAVQRGASALGSAVTAFLGRRRKWLTFSMLGNYVLY